MAINPIRMTATRNAVWARAGKGMAIMTIVLGGLMPAGCKKSAEKAYEECAALAAKENYGEAVKCYDKTLEQKADFAKAWNGKGLALYKQERLAAANLCYDKALKLNPDFAEAWKNKGDLSIDQGKTEEALIYIGKALKLKPDFAEAWNSKGRAFSKQSKFEEAMKCYNEALELKPDYAKAWHNKGNVFYKQGKLDEALKCFDKALELEPDYAGAWNNKGIVLEKQGKLDEANKCCDKAIELKPDFPEAWHNKGNVFYKQGKLDEALKCYDKTLELKPDEAFAWKNKGIVLEKQGKLDEANKCFERAKELKLKTEKTIVPGKPPTPEPSASKPADSFFAGAPAGLKDFIISTLSEENKTSEWTPKGFVNYYVKIMSDPSLRARVDAAKQKELTAFLKTLVSPGTSQIAPQPAYAFFAGAPEGLKDFIISTLPGKNNNSEWTPKGFVNYYVKIMSDPSLRARVDAAKQKELTAFLKTLVSQNNANPSDTQTAAE